MTAPAEFGPLFATLNVNVMVDPSFGVPVEPVFAMVTFAPAVGLTDTPADVEVWPDEFGVSDDCVSVAMLVIVPELAATRTVICNEAESPSAMVPSVQVTVGVPLTDASETEVDAPSVVVGAAGEIRVAVSLDTVWVAAADIVAVVPPPPSVTVVPDGMPKPDTRSTPEPLKLPAGPVSVVEPLVIEADETLVAAPYDT